MSDDSTRPPRIRRLGLVVRDRHLSEVASHRLAVLLERAGVELRALHEAETTEGFPPAESPPTSPPGDAPWVPDALLAMGGDGTVIRTLSSFPDVPVLAVNFGTVGFLTAGDEKDLERLVARLLEGDYFLDERLLLESLHDGRRHDVVNEVTIKGVTHMVSLALYIDDQYVQTIRGDGIIVGTPTGSTAYLLSLGSPIVTPTVQCMIIAGINEYRFSSRPLVVDPASTIRIRVEEGTREEEIILSHDCRDRIALAPGSEVSVARSDRKAHLIFLERDYFFRNLKARLNW